MIDRIIFRRRTSGLLATLTNAEVARNQPDIVYEGLVVDVILDHTHPEYAVDGYNVGTIKVRIFSINNSLDNDFLPWADPMDSALQEYPLYGELVAIYKVRGNFFYTRKLPLARRVQENSMIKLNEVLNRRPNLSIRQILKEQIEREIKPFRFGQYYRPDSRVRQLKHFEGDLLMQGKMGHSIRFGSSRMDPTSKGMAPNIILRTGQGKGLEEKEISRKTIFGLIMEDINKDVSSIWMVADQVVPFQPSTSKAGSFYRSIDNPIQKFDKGQIIINSDRVVLNSKNSHLMLFSSEEIYLNGLKQISLDTDDSIMLTANVDIENRSGKDINNIVNRDYMIQAGEDISVTAKENIYLAGKKIILNGLKDTEPIVGGLSLSQFLARLIGTLIGDGAGNQDNVSTTPNEGIGTVAHVITPLGPGLLNPTIVNGLKKLYAELAEKETNDDKPFTGAPFTSDAAHIGIKRLNSERGDIREIELNNFVAGEKIVVENNEWDLSDTTYYKVL